MTNPYATKQCPEKPYLEFASSVSVICVAAQFIHQSFEWYNSVVDSIKFPSPTALANHLAYRLISASSTFKMLEPSFFKLGLLSK